MDTGVEATAFKIVSATLDFSDRSVTVGVGLYLTDALVASGARPLETRSLRFDSDAVDKVLGAVDLSSLTMALVTTREPFIP
jgi:hypothetical protein